MIQATAWALVDAYSQVTVRIVSQRITTERSENFAAWLGVSVKF
jgi:hypothetical protein